MESRFQVVGQGTVYLLHFESKVAGQKRHYVGFTPLAAATRFKKHSSGEGDTQLGNFASKKGIGCVLAKVWENTPSEFERKLKREKNLKRHCPLCTQTIVPIPPQARLVPPEAG